MKIAIIGAGIGGLTAACLLADQGVAVTVFDQFETPAPVGSGLVIQPAVHPVLSKIGVLDTVISRGAKTYDMEGINVQNGRKILDVSYGPLGGSSFGLGIHRASLFDALYGAARARDIQWHLGLGITSKADIPDQGFDLIIDASGAGSALSPLEGRALPYGAVWATVN